jgi:ABC-2 type transport system ATP-binding protein
MSTVIETKHLTRRFGTNLAVDDLSLQINSGEVFGFLGHNGAGKTTTVRLINGVLSASGGEVRVFGMDPAKDGARIRARTGVLTETPALDDRLTARSTLTYFADMFGVPKAQVRRRVDELLEMFDLGARGDEKLGGFSKGMRQRVALARTLLHDPEIVFLDEPTSGLDPAATREVHLLIQTLRAQNRTVFLATHNLNEAERLCDRVAVLARGRVLGMGTVGELAARLERGHRLMIEVDGGRVGEAMQVLIAVPHVTLVEPSPDRNGEGIGGATVRVHGVGREQVPQLVGVLVGAGINLYRVEPDEASLEDVYFALEHN